MIPGSNLLNMAHSIISPETVQYYAYATRTLSPNKLWVTTLSAPVAVASSVQPIPREKYQINGLEFQKNYVNWYVSNNAIDVARDVAGDQFTYAGKRFQCVSRNNWFAQDGWQSILCVEIPLAG